MLWKYYWILTIEGREMPKIQEHPDKICPSCGCIVKWNSIKGEYICVVCQTVGNYSSRFLMNR